MSLGCNRYSDISAKQMYLFGIRYICIIDGPLTQQVYRYTYIFKKGFRYWTSMEMYYYILYKNNSLSDPCRPCRGEPCRTLVADPLSDPCRRPCRVFVFLRDVCGENLCRRPCRRPCRALVADKALLGRGFEGCLRRKPLSRPCRGPFCRFCLVAPLSRHFFG